MSASTEAAQPYRQSLLGRVWNGLTGRITVQAPTQEAAERERVSRIWGLDENGRPGRPYEKPRAASPAEVHVYLKVAYAEREKVKALGARWDKDRKAWYGIEGKTTDGLRPWAQDPRAAPRQSAPVVGEADRQHPAAPQYLEVPYGDRNDAKSKGARWNATARAWYAPAGLDLAPFSAWLSGNAKSAPDPVAQFVEALRHAGLRVENPEMDGKLHRVAVDGDRGREKSGAYIGDFDGHPSGFIQNFKTGEKRGWRYEGAIKSRSPSEINALAKEREQRRIENVKQIVAQHKQAAQTAAAIWAAAAPAPDIHPYLARKGIDSHGLRMGVKGQTVEVSDGKGGKRPMSVAGWLISPVATADRGLTSLQFISPERDRAKMFMPEGNMKGGHHMLGEVGQGAYVMVAEGLATAKTLHAITRMAVAVAYNAGNLQDVTAEIARQYPDRLILVAGDNDHKKEREVNPRTGKPYENVGKTSAEKAAASVNGIALVPPFLPYEKGSDWNDFAANQGQATTRSVLRDMLQQARKPVQQQERLKETAIPFEQRRGQERASGAEMER